MMLQSTSIDGYDFHCHVDLHKDPRATIARCESERLFTLAVTTTPKAFSTNCEWTRNSRYVIPAVGLHPELVADRFNELPLTLSLIKENAFIGEVGIDGSPQHKRSYEKQREAFSAILRTAQHAGGKVITIHSRRADKDVIELVEQFTTPDRVLCILHWFSGSQASVKRAALAGCYFSVNTNMLDSERAMALVGAMPPDRVLTETDSPFGLTDLRPSEPWDVIRTAERILSAGRTDGNIQQLRENSNRVLRFAGVID
jgi:TatD DNase family protein